MYNIKEAHKQMGMKSISEKEYNSKTPEMKMKVKPSSHNTKSVRRKNLNLRSNLVLVY